MRRKYILFLIFSFVLPLAAYGNNQEGSGPSRKIILIGWDGAQRSHIKESLERRGLYNLGDLILRGKIVAIDILGATDTKAGWAEILTGYKPEITGVFNNHNFSSIPSGYTMFERLEDFWGEDNIITVGLLSKEGVLDFNKECLDVFLEGLTDEEVGLKTQELLEKYKDKNFFIFALFKKADSQGHAFGGGSQEYDNALKFLDMQLGEIVRKLKQLNIYDKTLIYVTSDHGFGFNKNHEYAPSVFMATNDSKIRRRGKRTDIAPTILNKFGLNLKKVNPPLDGHSLTDYYQEPIW